MMTDKKIYGNEPECRVLESVFSKAMTWVYCGDDICYHAYPIHSSYDSFQQGYLSLCEEKKIETLATKVSGAPHCEKCLNLIKNMALGLYGAMKNE